jgi:outer membrane receptor protein involved in Fe transport
LSNENKPYDLYFGVRGGITKRMTYGISASFAKINNRAFFVTDTSYAKLGNQFYLVYDSLNLTSIEANLSYQINEKLKIDGIGRFNSYEMKNEARAWNLPQLQFILRGTYNLYDKFLIRADLTMESGRMAKVNGPGNGVLTENNQYFIPLGFLADGNLGVEYRYNKRVSAFLQINNIASQRYSRWLNYPVMPIQIMGGITARF